MKKKCVFAALIFLYCICNSNFSFSQIIINKYNQANKANFIISPDTTFKGDKAYLNPDTINYSFIKLGVDSSFSYKKYADFLQKISDTSKYIVLPMNEFITTINPKKIVIGLRHDVDLDLNVALKLGTVENNFGQRSSYYILHTASYYLANSSNMAIHNEGIIPTLKIFQNSYGHEIGWHNDLITLQLVYKIDPQQFLKQELNWLRGNGINVYGTASHGSNYCYVYKYVNWYFWKEFPNPNVEAFSNYESAVVGGQTIVYKKSFLKDYDLTYETYFTNFNKYFSDASYVNGMRWNVNMLDLSTLKPGDRVQILMHPIYYSAIGSTQSDINSFSLPGQINSIINPEIASIFVQIPAGEKIDSLKPIFEISPKARALIGSKQIHSNSSILDFSKIQTIKIVAENALNQKDWRIITGQNPNLNVSDKNLQIGWNNNSSTSFVITSNTLWNITSQSSWLTIDAKNGSRSQEITVSATLNPLAETRVGTIKVVGVGVQDQIITVTQEASPPYLTLSSSTVSVGSGQNSKASFNIISNTNWTITCNENWLYTDVAIGKGNKIITITAQANTDTKPRNATIIVHSDGVQDKILNVTQDAFIPRLTISSQTLTLGYKESSSANFNINSNTSWSISCDQGWLTPNITSGNNNATITLTASKNPSSSQRSAIVTITGYGVSKQVLTVNQEGSPAYLTISITSIQFEATENRTATFTISSNTNWNISTNELWISTDYTSGRDNKTITITAEQNPNSIPRTAILTISGSGIPNQTIAITQVANTPVLTVSSDSLTIGYFENSKVDFDIISNIHWSISITDPWFNSNALSGDGNKTITLTADKNTLSSTRKATLTVYGEGVATKTIIITQEGFVPFLNLSTNTLQLKADENSSIAFDINSNTSWNLSVSDSWITAECYNGNDNKTVTITAQENTSFNKRYSTITISGEGISNQLISIIQEGSSVILKTSTTELSIGADLKNTATFDIVSNSDWRLSIMDTWLTADYMSGNGNRTITISAEPNPMTEQRTTTITISAEGASPINIVVNQDLQTGITPNTTETFTLYPNPATSILYIQGINNLSTITITDIFGRVIISREIETNTIDIAKLPSGIYTVRITDRYRSSSKLIIKN